MNLSRFATEHRTSILFATIALSLLGALIVGTFPVSILPDMVFPRIVMIAHVGNSPSRMVEASITRPLEQAVASVIGVQRIRSRTMRGGCEISVDFGWNTDMFQALQLVSNRISEIRSSLPAGTQISIHRMNPTLFPILGLSLHSKHLSQSQLYDLAEYTLRPRLARVPGVGRVEVQGGRIREYKATADPQKLAAYRLTLQNVIDALHRTNVVRSVGIMNRRFQQFQVVTSGYTTDPAELGKVVVASHNGVPITVNDVARVHADVEDTTSIVTANGSQAVLLNIIRQPNANTVTVVNAVRREMQNLQPLMPQGTQVGTFYDQSILIKQAIQNVRDSVLLGGLLAVFVLMLFLGNLRATAVTATVIPVTMLITFLLMRALGQTLNLMTLGALAVGIGLVIDDAIVVVENVVRHLSHGETPRESVVTAASEIAPPMVSATLTTVVVFLPLILVAGVTGAFFTALAITLTVAVLASLVLALLVTPSLCAAFLRVKPGTPEHSPQFERLINLYERVAKFVVKRLWISITLSLAVFAATIWIGTHLGTGFMPNMDEGSFILDYWTPTGTSLPESNRILIQIENILHNTPEVKAFSRRTGAELGFALTPPNKGDFTVMLHTRRNRNIDTIMNSLRAKIESSVPGVKIDFIEVLQDLIGDLSGAPAPIEVKIFGSNLAELKPVAEQVSRRLATANGVVDVNNGIINSPPELVIHPDARMAGRLGLTPHNVASQANAAIFGDVATYLNRHDRLVAVRVRYPLKYRSDESNIQQMMLQSPAGVSVPLGTVATVTPVLGNSEITRENQRLMLDVTARLSGSRDLGSVMAHIRRVMDKMSLPPAISYKLGGLYQSQKQSFHSLLIVLALAILLVFVVMIMKFESFTAPLVILFAMPLPLLGSVLGLYITGIPFNVSSFMGTIMLAGLVVKNGIILLDYARRAEADGFSPEEAVAQSGRVRLRPIIMTTLAAMFGLLPLALGIGAGSQMQQPLAIAVIGGLSITDFFTLLVIPSFYVGLRRFQRSLIWKRLWRNFQPAVESPPS